MNERPTAESHGDIQEAERQNHAVTIALVAIAERSARTRTTAVTRRSRVAHAADPARPRAITTRLKMVIGSDTIRLIAR